ncbi:iron-sulfur cluster assembly accessory protein, partial [Rhizobium ruizarguesonis]
MGFAIMSMTDGAAARVKAIVENSGPDAKGVRVGITKGGCAGMEYTIDLVTEPNAKDDLIERDGAKVWFEPSAARYLLGTEMGFETTTRRSGFTVTNP